MLGNRAFGDDDVGKGRDALEVGPGVEPRDRVHSQYQTQRNSGELLAQLPQRVRGHGRSDVCKLAPVRFEPGDVGKRAFEQTHAYFGARHRWFAQPRTACGHQTYRVETQGRAQLQGEADVRAVHRVERSAENPDCTGR